MQTPLKYILLFCTAAMVGCNGCGEKKEISDAEVNRIQQGMIKETKKQHEQEIKDIRHFIKKNNWPMQETASGLQYWIYEPAADSSSKGKIEDIASISYVITLLDGTECYKTSDAAPKQVRIGRDNVETGLHEALQLMRVGDKAKFIMPSHLAFGFTGDSGKIPQNATVVYDLHLIALD